MEVYKLWKVYFCWTDLQFMYNWYLIWLAAQILNFHSTVEKNILLDILFKTLLTTERFIETMTETGLQEAKGKKNAYTFYPSLLS